LSFNSLHSACLLFAVFAAAGCKQNANADNDKANARVVAPVEQTVAPPATETEARAFCNQTLDKTVTCFDDAAFWDNFATTWFAKYPDMSGNPDAKNAWIGMRKDDIVGLRQDGQLAQNCDIMVRKNRLPTAADMAPVTAAMHQSCSAFGTAMGLMLFHTGVFHMPR
jgi:hypothetical protein